MSRCASPVTLVEPVHPMVFAPVSRPPSPPPPNSPASASPSTFSIPFNRPSRRLLVSSRQRAAVFDLHSSSPISPTAVEKTILKTQLDRAKSTKVLIRPGAPARALTDEELRTLKKEEEDSATTSGGGEGPLSPPEEEESAWVDEPASHSKTQPTAIARQLKPTADATVPIVVAGSPLRQVVGFAEPSTSPEQSADSQLSSAETNSDRAKPAHARPPFHRSRTAPSTPSISPTSYLSTLLSRQTPSVTPPQLDRSPVMGSTTLLEARSSSFDARQAVRSTSTWTTDVLATALKVVKAPSMPIMSTSKLERKRPGGVATKPPSPASSSPSSPRSKALGKTRSLPSPAPPSTSPGKYHHHTTRIIRSPSSVPPLPFALPSPSLSLPSHLPSSSRSWTRAPPSPSIAPVMSSTDPSALMLHFARHPDSGRKASLGDGWTRVRMPGDPRSHEDDGGCRRAVDTSEAETETETDTGDEDDEDPHFGSKSRFNLRNSCEGSVFASAGANSAASLTSSASSSLLLSRPPSVTHSRKPSASPDSSPKLVGSAALAAAFSDPAALPPAPFPSVIDTFVSKDRTAALLAQTVPPPPPHSQHALDLHAALKAKEQKPIIDLKQLRREQASRRQAAEEETTTTSASSSEDEEDARKKALEVVLAARARRGKRSSPTERAGAAVRDEPKSDRAREPRRKLPVASARAAES